MSAKTLMIVEDDTDIREALAELLMDAGYQVTTAVNGADALEVLRRAPLPNLILLDLMMPVMDGFAFREEQRKVPAWAAVPVLLMSADGNIASKQAKAQAAAYVRKPIDIHDLLALISQHCG